ncbi:MAG: PAS domain S-box protein, partial [Bacteroidales bacterium]
MLRAERKKVSLIITGLILILITIVYVFWISNQYRNLSLEASKENLLGKAQNLKLFIESHLHEDVQDLEGVSRNHEISNYSNDTNKHDQDFCHLEVVQHANNTEFVLVAFLNKDGMIEHVHYKSPLDSVENNSLINFPEVSQVINNQKPVIGKSYPGKGDARLINLVFPVFSEGNFSGAIFVAYDITAFCKKYFNSVYHRVNTIEITDEEGHYLFNSHPGIPDLGNYLVNNDSVLQNLQPTNRGQYEKLIHHIDNHENNSTIVTYLDHNNNPDQVVLAHIPLLIGQHYYRILVYDNLNKSTHLTFFFIRNIFYVLAVLIAIFILFWIFGWSWLHHFVKVKKEVTMLSKISQSENRYWELFNASPIPIVVLTPTGMIKMGNQQFLNYIGLNHLSEVFGKNLVEVIHFTDSHQLTSLFQLIKRKLKNVGYARLQMSFHHSDGSLKTGEFIGSEFKFDQQKNVLCIINDLTEKQLAENLSLRFGRILSNSFNEIYIIDVQTHLFLLATDGALKNLGYTSEELCKLTPNQLAKFGEGNFETVIKPLIDRTQDQIFFELLLQRKNGQSYPVEVSLQISHEENPPVFIAIMRDLTQVKKAAETISEERSKAMEYLELAEVMFVAIDRSFNITLINRKGCEILGYTQEELIGRNWIESCLPNQARMVVQDNFRHIMDEGQIAVNYFENQVITKQNHHKLISWQNKSILNNSGEIVGFLCSGMDISEARKQEYDLKESQRKYSTLIGNLNGIVYRCQNDPSWTLEFISHGVYKMTGYAPEELQNNNSSSFNNIIHPEDRNHVNNTIKKALNTNQNYQIEYRIITKNKQIIWVSEIGKGIKEEGKIQYLEGFITDITKQRQAQEELIISQMELEKSAALFKALSGASFEAIFISKHGICIGLNRTAELMFGYSEDEALGKKDTQWFVPGDHELIKQRFLGGSEEPFESTALRIDGETFPCEIKTRVAEYQGNMVLFTSITDISRRKEAQKNLLESEA